MLKTCEVFHCLVGLILGQNSTLKATYFLDFEWSCVSKLLDILLILLEGF